MTSLRQATSRAEVDRLGADVTLIAGGTDVLVQRRAGRFFPPLADISRIGDAGPAVTRSAQGLALSAVAPIEEVARGLGSQLPALRTAIAAFASLQIRNRATLGGNLANASPAADTVPPLVSARAQLLLRAETGTRLVPVDAFATGPGRTVLVPGEWIEAVHVLADDADPTRHAGFVKIAGRRALAISIVNLAWSWRLDDGVLRDVCLAAGAVAATVRRCPRAEAVLEGRPPGDAATRAAVTAIRGDVAPIDDLRASAHYRYAALSGALTEALLTEALPNERERTERT